MKFFENFVRQSSFDDKFKTCFIGDEDDEDYDANDDEYDAEYDYENDGFADDGESEEFYMN